MILSILIPTLRGREVFLNELLDSLHSQIDDNNSVEICIDHSPDNFTTGQKRNDLLKIANGKYSWFIDDDDEIASNAIELILKALKSNPDVIGINGWMTTDGENRVDWEMKLGHPYCATTRDGKEFYLRFPNHIAVMRRDIAYQVKFPHVTMGEDYAWAKEINDRGLLKTEAIIDQPIYHYKFRTKK